MSHGLELSMRVDIEPSVARVHYVVKSRAPLVAYLLNLLHRGTPESVDPQLVYVELEPRARTVIVEKLIPDLPTDRNVYQPVAPYVTRLAPGGEFAETLSLALPIRERREYYEADDRPLAHERYSTLRLRLGYYLAPEGTREEYQDAGDRRLVLPRVPPGTRPDFGEIVAEQSALSIAVFAPKT